MTVDTPITELLGEWADGDREALNDLMSLVYAELRQSARRVMAGERASHTLEPTALVNEVYLRLLRLQTVSWEGRRAFFAFSARLMRHVLVEHARAMDAQKRGGRVERVHLDRAEIPVESATIDLLVLDDALRKLQDVDPRFVQIVELRYFGGLTEEETAEALQTSRSSVQREWAVAKRLLAQLLGTGQPEAR